MPSEGANAFVGELILEALSLHVASWSPSSDPRKPPTQVHIIVEMKELPYPIVIRIKSRDACSEIIQALRTHRDDVWPKPD